MSSLIYGWTPTRKIVGIVQKEHMKLLTFASNCIANGMNPKTLQRIMGHSTLQMTMNLYCHVLDETIEKEMTAVIEIGTKMGQ